ncbi:MAG: methyltransferase [Hyphomicrobiaceae bacterium]|nr:methyltransferase [Hyphomicrobiaceae bacterium]
MTPDDTAPDPGARRLVIEAIGARADGIARDAQGRAVFVPFALPGETVEIDDAGAGRVVGPPAPARAAPPCPHFTVCGGCLAQHMPDAVYADWKRGLVVACFAERGLAAAPVGALVRLAGGTRRRAVLTARRTQGAVALGYHARRSHDLVDIAVCCVLEPEIVRVLPALRSLVAILAVKEARLTVLATPAGLDVAVAADLARVTPEISSALARLAEGHRFARISLDGNPILVRAMPALDIAGVAVTPPPGGFVQAVAAAEEAMRGLVQTGVGNARRVADLFCGVGAFSLALARTARVRALDSDKAALATLSHAARHAQGLKPIEVLARDLFREPLAPGELAGLDAVVLDPPRAGAEAQAQALSVSDVPLVAYVSCNPATLARDARHLTAGGYAIEAVTPIDQFLYSDHVEAVAILRKPARRRRR